MATVSFEGLNAGELKKLEQYLRDGLEEQKGFVSLVMSASGTGGESDSSSD